MCVYLVCCLVFCFGCFCFVFNFDFEVVWFMLAFVILFPKLVLRCVLFLVWCNWFWFDAFYGLLFNCLLLVGFILIWVLILCLLFCVLLFMLCYLKFWCWLLLVGPCIVLFTCLRFVGFTLVVFVVLFIVFYCWCLLFILFIFTCLTKLNWCTI